MRSDLDDKKEYIISSLLSDEKNISELCRELNCKYDTLRVRIKRWLPEYVPDNTKKLRTYGGHNKWKSLNEYFLNKGESCKRDILFRLLCEERGCVCSECGINSTWNGKYLRLQVDHINGLCYDNSPDNLRLLCPNCHSQTETYCNRNTLAPVAER